jgi:16S rRNA C967 or C1407 C5-methylase (RsmB/RsmF family)
LRLLLALLPRLAPGGRLVYSTCSLEPEENALLVAHVLAQLDGFEQIDSLARLPTRDGTDGAFAALLAHRGSHVTTCVG